MENIAVKGDKKLLKALAEQWEENGFKQLQDSAYRPEKLYLSSTGKFWFRPDGVSYKMDQKCKIYNVLENWEYLASLTPEPNTPDIEINGYQADFHDDYVQFGCTKIYKQFFIAASHLIENDHIGIVNKQRASWEWCGITDETTYKDAQSLDRKIVAIAEYYKSRD